MTTLTHHTLSNGLTVLLRESHSAPVISWWLAYRVGSLLPKQLDKSTEPINNHGD